MGDMTAITDIVKSLVDKQVAIATMDGQVTIVLHLMITPQQSNQQPTLLLHKRLKLQTTHVMESIVITAIVLLLTMTKQNVNANKDGTEMIVMKGMTTLLQEP